MYISGARCGGWIVVFEEGGAWVAAGCHVLEMFERGDARGDAGGLDWSFLVMGLW